MGSTERTGAYSVGVNLGLASLKLGLAALTGSLTLAADALHSLVDVVASLVVLGGLLIARRRSSSFPYGLYKVENVVSVVVALLIFLEDRSGGSAGGAAGGTIGWPTVSWLLPGVKARSAASERSDVSPGADKRRGQVGVTHTDSGDTSGSCHI